MSRKVMWMALVALLMVALAGCGGGSKGGGSAMEVTVSSSGADLKFAPNTFSFKAGTPVKLTYNNNGSVEHDFVIDNIATKEGKPVSLKVAAGKSASLSFTPSKDGSFTAYCSVPGHKDAGMTAQVTVAK